jgi:hypothetical protein
MTDHIEGSLRQTLHRLSESIEAAPDLENRIAAKFTFRRRRRRNRAAIASAAVVTLTGFAIALAFKTDPSTERLRTAQSPVSDSVNAAGSAPSASDIQGGRFTRTVILDGGGLSVRPASTNLQSEITEAQARVLVASDSTVYGKGWSGDLGFAVVSIAPELTGGIANSPAWVALIPQGVPLCPLDHAHAAPSAASTSATEDPGYLAVIVEGSGQRVIDYRSRYQVCNYPAQGPMVSAGMTYRYQVPACDPDANEASGPSIAVSGDAEGQSIMEAMINTPYNISFNQLMSCGGPVKTGVAEIGPLPSNTNAPPPIDVVAHAPTGPVGASS